ncbi:D-lactaldehyde dehydrogenase [Cubamyces sp. BRFM 1775]|nr:D-lactaldehyde dehydrogenase [Cubamyces sp. BRFM 1775]
MPAIPPRATVLVTGANGYIGVWAVLALLSRGYSVRGTVRSPNKVGLLSEIVFRKAPGAKARFTGHVVPDITAPGAFHEAVKDVDGVIHLASPTSIGIVDPKDAIEPAVRGTTSILASVLGEPRIKRVVVASSISAIASASVAPTRVYTEDNWNDQAVRIVDEQGANAPGLVKYEASKTLAERAAWAFLEMHKSEAKFDLVVVNPSLVYGPVADDTLTSPDSLPITPGMVWNNLFARPAPREREPKVFNSVDVRDIKDIMVRALEIEVASGQRIIANSQVSTWDEWVLISQELNLLRRLERVDSEVAKRRPEHLFFSNEKAKQLFGMEMRTIHDTMKDTVADFKSRGWLTHLE